MHAVLVTPRGTSAAEDFAIATPFTVTVLAGEPTSAEGGTGCQHGTAWFVRQLGGAVVDQANRDPGRSLVDCLAKAIVNTNALHMSRCDLADPGNPAASVAVVRTLDDVVEYLVLGRTGLLLDQVDQVRVVIGDRPPPAGLSQSQPGPARVMSDPAVVDAALTGAVPRAQVRRVVAVSRGLASAALPEDRELRRVLDLLKRGSATALGEAGPLPAAQIALVSYR
jgi:hypothetical protein